METYCLYTAVFFKIETSQNLDHKKWKSYIYQLLMKADVNWLVYNAWFPLMHIVMSSKDVSFLHTISGSYSYLLVFIVVKPTCAEEKSSKYYPMHFDQHIEPHNNTTPIRVYISITLIGSFLLPSKKICLSIFWILSPEIILPILKFHINYIYIHILEARCTGSMH